MSFPKPLAFLLFGLLAVTARAEVLVDEDFSDNERRNDDPPGSLLWTYGAHHNTAANAFTSLDASGGELLWDHTNGNNSFSGIWGHFTDGDTPFTLEIGQTLTLEFDVSFSGGAFSTSSSGFRWGLFDSNDSRVTTDFAGANMTGISSGSVFSSWDGYTGQATINNAASTGGLIIRERTGTGGGLYTSGNYSAVGGAGGSDLPASATGTTYHGTLTLERTAGGMVVQTGFNGVLSPAGTDTTPVTQFDTISFFVLDGVTHDVKLDNITLTVTPEPSSTALLAMAGAAMLGGRWRRRAARM